MVGKDWRATLEVCSPAASNRGAGGATRCAWKRHALYGHELSEDIDPFSGWP